MKTLFKILRSILTSLLFLVLIFAIIVQFTFTIVKTSPKRVSDLIVREEILDTLLDGQNLDEETREVAIDYIDEYIGYVFYKRSYPSIQTVDLSRIPEENRTSAKQTLTELNKNLDVEYENIVTLRKINNFISNGAIYLLINIAVFVIFLLIIISTFNIKKSFLFLGAATVLGGLISLIGSIIVVSILEKLLPSTVYNLLNSVLSDQFMSRIHAQAFIYIFIGLVIFLPSLLLIKKYSLKKQNSTK